MWKDCMKCTKGLGLFGAGVLFGTAGLKILGSQDAKKVYTNVVAAGLRGRECVMKATVRVQENAEDVLAEAKEINRQREEEQKQEEVE